MDLSHYEQIMFSEKTTNRTVSRDGYKVGDFLVVSYLPPWRGDRTPWRVYRFTDGLVAIKTTFASPEDAIRFAEWLDKTYSEFMFIWTEYPHIDLYQITHLTIENGKKYWEYLKELKTQRNIEWSGYV
jgi:hypothetical protein